MPLLNGSERLGVLELSFTAPASDVAHEARLLADLAAALIVVKDASSDAFSRLRRRRTPSLAAEIQWELLPPLTFSTGRVTIAGALEPAYEIGGDSFDYSVTGDHADVALFDAVGHGLPAAMMASLAVNAYRHARRDRLGLPDIAVVVNDVIAGHFDGSRFVTALLARLDLETGAFAWVNAGHAEPLILREGALIPTPPNPPGRPLGLQEDKPPCRETRLQPGDRLLLYTDGIVEARRPDGESFGEDRLADFLIQAEAAGDPPPETMRRLIRHIMEHQADQLQDDGTAVLLEWHGGRRRTSSPG
ncbi:PP2C family protein-serine/threonine phosphatase [Modestobacter lacusdianchii]